MEEAKNERIKRKVNKELKKKTFVELIQNIGRFGVEGVKKMYADFQDRGLDDAR